MRLSCTLLVFALITIADTFPLHAQITIIGPLKLGDSSQAVLLKTQRDDVLLGRVISMTPDSVIFKSLTGQNMVFPNALVKSIEAIGKNESAVKGGDVFALKMKRGKVFYGYPINIKRNKVTFNVKRQGNVTKPIRAIERITREYAAVYDNSVSPNDFIASFSRKTESRGQFLAYHDGVIVHRDEQGMDQHLNLDELKKYKLVYPYQEITGYGRVVMFSPTGFGMSDGELGFRSILLGLNTLTYGVNDHFSVGLGAFSFLPYLDAKVNQSFGEFIHVSAGAYIFSLFSYGFHTSMSFGTPDYFLNLSYLKSKEIESIDSDMNFDSWSFGSSLRIGPKTRFFTEYNIITSPPNSFGYDVFGTYGYANGFSFGLTKYRNKSRWDYGIMNIGPIVNCFPARCEPIHVPIFFVSFGYKFGS